MHFSDPGFAPQDMDVQVFDLAVVEAGGRQVAVDPAVLDVLGIASAKMGLDIVFVCEVPAEGPAQAAEQLSEAGQFALFDSAFGVQLAQAALAPLARQRAGRPAPVAGCHGVPVVRADGRIYGALYMLREPGDAQRQREALRSVEVSAQLIARRMDERRQQALRMAAAPIPAAASRGIAQAAQASPGRAAMAQPA